MSDNGYDNVELNDLINDLKNVGDKTSSCKNTEKITFQFTNPTRDSKSHREENIGFAQHCKRDINKNNNELHLNRSEVYTLQRELSIVKQELALLKRSQSLASHPIFSENLSDNRKMNFETEKDMNLNLYPDFKQLNLRNPGKFSGTSNILRNNFSSVTNIACQTSNSNKMQYQSLTRLNSPLSYSAHRENLEKVRLLPIDCNLRTPNNYETFYDKTEEYSMQPIGKGIQTLNGSLSNMTKTDQYCHRKIENDENKSSFFDLMRAVKSSKNLWFKLDATQNECKHLLSTCEAGSFLIRIQSECKIQINGGMMFELILKVNDYSNYELYDDNYEFFSLKEFVETVLKGIKLIGHAIEPIFPTLDSFVAQHLEIPLGLPCCLKLPRVSYCESSCKSNKNLGKPKLSLPFNILSKRLSGSLTSVSSIKSQVTVTTYAQPTQAKLNAELLFLGKVTVDRLNGLNAIRHAVDKTLANGYQPKNCIEVNVYFDSLSGISIVDIERILFCKKFLSASSIIYCDVDPLHRGLNSEYLNAKGIKNAKIFGVLYQKRKILIKENKVIVFAEFNPITPMDNILNFVKNHLIHQNTL